MLYNLLQIKIDSIIQFHYQKWSPLLSTATIIEKSALLYKTGNIWNPAAFPIAIKPAAQVCSVLALTDKVNDRRKGALSTLLGVIIAQHKEAEDDF